MTSASNGIAGCIPGLKAQEFCVRITEIMLCVS